jgi:hypothetical protein
VRIGAVVTRSEPTENEVDFLPLSPAGAKRLRFRGGVPRISVLGNDLGECALRKLHDLGLMGSKTVAAKSETDQVSRSSFTNRSDSEWEAAIAGWVAQDVEILFLLRAGIYTDLNFRELLDFHLERKAALTQVYAADGCLDIAVVSAGVLRAADRAAYKGTLSALLPRRERFFYGGYVNRLRKAADFMRLVEDGLYGRCDLRPAGSEIASGVWFGEGAEVEPSCRIGAPCYLGAGTRIAACCTIGGGSAIEGACEIDSGTRLENAWVLPGTYVGVGLNVRRSIVSRRQLFHMERETQITITDPRLIGATRSLSWFGAGGLTGRAPLSARAQRLT